MVYIMAMTNSTFYKFNSVCWCHKVWYHVTMMIISMMVWFFIWLIVKKEEPRVAHLAICTRLALSHSLRESLGSFAFWVIHFLGFYVIHSLPTVSFIILYRDHKTIGFRDLLLKDCLQLQVPAKIKTSQTSKNEARYIRNCLCSKVGAVREHVSDEH
jgi:hypothetical protein